MGLTASDEGPPPPAPWHRQGAPEMQTISTLGVSWGQLYKWSRKVATLRETSGGLSGNGLLLRLFWTSERFFSEIF